MANFFNSAPRVLSIKNCVKSVAKVGLGPMYTHVAKARGSLRYRLGERTYSQEGEDRILFRLFEKQQDGFYVDVGAHHPHRFSNTYLFYRRGWKGINIDATPGSMTRFRRFRPRDINLEVGILGKGEPARFFLFDEPALNGFWSSWAAAQETYPEYSVIEEIVVDTYLLSEILRDHLPSGQEIDFFSIDAEGRDYDVISSNDWSRFRPKVVLVEILGKDIRGVIASPFCQYIEAQGYELYCKLCNSVFFLEVGFKKRQCINCM